METRCQRCGTPAAGGQAFCAKCGAVLGMVDEARDDASPNLAATMVGAKLPTPAPRQAPRTPAPPQGRAASPAPAPAAPARGGNALMIALAVGLVAVLLVGTLLLFFFLLSRG